MKDSSELYKITEELVKRGYKDEDIKKILGKNILRVIQATEDLATIPNRSEGISLIPNMDMGQVIGDPTPLLTAKVNGTNSNEESFRVIIDGIVYKPNFDKMDSTISIQVKDPFTEKFHVITFQASDNVGGIQRATRIFYID